IADEIKALLVKSLLRQLRRLPVARRDIGAAHAHLELVAGGNELQFSAGNRHADIARAFGEEMAVGRERRGLGRAPGRHHRQRPCSRKVQVCALACWLEVSMRWVLMTAFGVPVEPEVNRNFAIVSGVTAAKAFATPGVSGVAAMVRNASASASSALPLMICA